MSISNMGVMPQMGQVRSFIVRDVCSVMLMRIQPGAQAQDGGS